MALDDELAGSTSLETPPDFDYEASAARVSAMLGEEYAAPYKDTAPVETPGLQDATAQPSALGTAPSQSVSAVVPPPSASTPVYDVPKSWKKEMHPHWEKVAPEAKAYIIEREKQLLDGFSAIRPVQEAVKPYMEYLNSRNVPVHQAVDTLLRAQVRLTTGTIDQRRQWYQQLGKELGLADTAPTSAAPTAPVDPVIQSLQQETASIKQQLEAQHQATVSALYEENKKKIDAIANDTVNYPYFEEVADDMVIFLNRGASLQDAYAKAVRVNESVWAKEQARILTEHEAKLRENARLAALPKKRAASVNIQSDRDGPEPTEPLGTLEDTIRSTHRAIKGRA